MLVSSGFVLHNTFVGLFVCDVQSFGQVSSHLQLVFRVNAGHTFKPTAAYFFYRAARQSRREQEQKAGGVFWGPSTVSVRSINTGDLQNHRPPSLPNTKRTTVVALAAFWTAQNSPLSHQQIVLETHILEEHDLTQRMLWCWWHVILRLSGNCAVLVPKCRRWQAERVPDWNDKAWCVHFSGGNFLQTAQLCQYIY